MKLATRNSQLFSPAFLLPLLAAALVRAEDPLPQRAPGDSGLDFEPKLMLETPAAGPLISTPAPRLLPEDRVRKCEAALLQAQQRAADSDQLFKEGILARVEIEARYLAIIRTRKDLAEARLDVAAAHADAVKRSFDAHECPQADLEAANAGLAAARQAAGAASGEWAKAQLDAALIDLKRKRKLYTEGVCSRREVQVAEDRVAMLSGTGAR